VLQCVAVRCSVLQCVAASWHYKGSSSNCGDRHRSGDLVFRVFFALCIELYCSVLQSFAVFCSVLQCVVVYCCVLLGFGTFSYLCCLLQCVAVCCSVLTMHAHLHTTANRVAVCCSVLQCV